MSNEEKSGAKVHELIAFKIGEQDFCIDIKSVREIRSFTAATPLPHAPAFVTGVINLRGTVLPIVDLADRLGFQPTQPHARSAIIVVKVQEQLIGLLVDGVSSILTVSDDLLQPTPDVASELSRSFVNAVMAVEGQMVSLLTAEAILPEKIDLAA
ncbi:chemotaxis protein CheW [Mangrovibrevibacter kandeliae]|uniref:chemotaxis protein CheW n=1 Tax=Mangrovibrevibacter kandeliae TaxID=2968473 RepID=UPI002118250C|nr:MULTISPECIES: chemotaxis protein CheW [unclassified Aurantimonas]MCQ8783648.1 chemotaxis protein CheW [Aurantimonas sp. CSK15Z-1]MCW4116389.1 chemotaxis protein CheW [Aurantimonas sp. MSK8Z-1]